MRIISGEAKGRTLFAPSGTDTRPTSDKIRGSLFNIIGARVLDARVLDLFGGTGALALEGNKEFLHHLLRLPMPFFFSSSALLPVTSIFAPKGRT